MQVYVSVLGLGLLFAQRNHKELDLYHRDQARSIIRVTTRHVTHRAACVDGRGGVRSPLWIPAYAHTHLLRTTAARSRREAESARRRQW